MMESNKEINIINEVRNKNGTLIKVNDYELCCVLGQGQFGKVYLVENINDKIRYAMKVLKRQKKAKRSARGLSANNNDDDMIMNEVKIMQSLNHPHIVNLIAFINDPTMSNTNVYLIIDYVDGGSVMIIKGLNDNGTPKFVCPVEGTVLGESRSCSLAAQIFDAMSYVHHHKVAHRDIKMDNILLDLNGNVRIADFGVSHYFITSEEDLESSPKAFCKDTAGTFSFWSPEILEDKEEGYDVFAADVWAMGIVLWCFLFGELPYPALEADLLFESITVGGIPSLPTRKSPECEDILNKMLMRAPDDRITFDGLLKHAWIVDHEKPNDESSDRPDLKAFKETSVSKKLLSWEKSASSKVIKRTSILKMQKEESIKNLKEKMQAENDDDNTENDQTTVYNTEVIINVNKVEVDMKNDQNKQQLNACCILS